MSGYIKYNFQKDDAREVQLLWACDGHLLPPAPSFNVDGNMSTTFLDIDCTF